MVIVLALTACMGGPNLQTRIGELRVVAAQADPAAVAPGEVFELRLWIADPLDLGAEVVSWSCLDDLPCGPEHAVVPERTDGITPSLVQTRVAVPAPLWVLSCAPGDCGNLEDPPVGRMRDPLRWLQTLPLAGVSAASRLPPIGEAVNPAITEAPDPVLDRSASEVALSFAVADAEEAWGYATSGGFDTPSAAVVDGAVTLTWLPDPEQEGGEAFVVFTNALGGVGVWQAEIP